MRPPRLVFRALGDVLDLGAEVAAAVGLLTLSAFAPRATGQATGTGAVTALTSIGHVPDVGSDHPSALHLAS